MMVPNRQIIIKVGARLLLVVTAKNRPERGQGG
jgi:hypothetical protein